MKAIIIEVACAIGFALMLCAGVWYGVATSPLYGWL
jgi:hypothetical protein